MPGGLKLLILGHLRGFFFYIILWKVQKVSKNKVNEITVEYRYQIQLLKKENEELRKIIQEKDNIIKRSLIKLEDATKE